MNKTKKSIIVFLLAAALLISVVSGLSQTWDFNNDDKMYKGVHTETGTETINIGASNIWTAEHDAEVDVGFNAETWNGQLECTSPSANKKFTVEIGIWGGSSFIPKGKSAETILDHASGFGKVYSLTASAFTVPTNDWLAVRVNNTGTENFVLKTDGSCFITYPYDEPDYPYPELSTLVLLSFGLLALFGYVVYRRRNNKQ